MVISAVSMVRLSGRGYRRFGQRWRENTQITHTHTHTQLYASLPHIDLVTSRTTAEHSCFIQTEMKQYSTYLAVSTHTLGPVHLRRGGEGVAVAARFVTTARFVKFDAQPARFVTRARFVTTWWQNVPKGPLAARFVTPSPVPLSSVFPFPQCACVCVDVNCPWQRERVRVCVVVYCVVLSPSQSVLNWNSVLLWTDYEATAARSSVSCVKYDYRYRDEWKCGLIVCCGCPVGIILLFGWMAGIVWRDRR